MFQLPQVHCCPECYLTCHCTRDIGSYLACYIHNRTVCRRMALTNALRSNDGQFACRVAQELLKDQPKDAEKLENILMAHKDSLDTGLPQYKCPRCDTVSSCGNVSCSNCQSPILMCWRTYGVISVSDYVCVSICVVDSQIACSTCDAVYLADETGADGSCMICHNDTLKLMSM